MTPEEMRKVHDEHVAAENRRDVEGAVATYHEECFYENIPLGLRFEGRDALALQYAASFAAFPGAEWTIEGEAFGEDVMVAWGTFRAGELGEFLGVKPAGSSVEFPIISVVPFKDGKMQGERVFYDLASVCTSAGVSLEEVLAAAQELRG